MTHSLNNGQFTYYFGAFEYVCLGCLGCHGTITRKIRVIKSKYLYVTNSVQKILSEENAWTPSTPWTFFQFKSDNSRCSSGIK